MLTDMIFSKLYKIEQIVAKRISLNILITLIFIVAFIALLGGAAIYARFKSQFSFF